MQIKQLNKSAYAGRKFTARYFTDGYYDIRQTESGFNIAYTPFEKTLEKSLDYEFFEEWLEDPVAFGAFDGGESARFCRRLRRGMEQPLPNQQYLRVR